MNFFSKLIFQALFLTFLAFLLGSCNKDEVPTRLDNHIIFNGKKYPINNAKLTYVDDADLRHHDPDNGVTHYHQSMRFSDGIIDPTPDIEPLRCLAAIRIKTTFRTRDLVQASPFIICYDLERNTLQ